MGFFCKSGNVTEENFTLVQAITDYKIHVVKMVISLLRKGEYDYN